MAYRWSCTAQRVAFLSSCALRSDDTEARKEARRCFSRSDRSTQTFCGPVQQAFWQTTFFRPAQDCPENCAMVSRVLRSRRSPRRWSSVGEPPSGTWLENLSVEVTIEELGDLVDVDLRINEVGAGMPIRTGLPEFGRAPGGLL